MVGAVAGVQDALATSAITFDETQGRGASVQQPRRQIELERGKSMVDPWRR